MFNGEVSKSESCNELLTMWIQSPSTLFSSTDNTVEITYYQYPTYNDIESSSSIKFCI